MFNPGDVLGYDPTTTEFALYDEYFPRTKIVLAGGETAATIAAAAARTNDVNVAMVYSTDGGIVSAQLRVLEDDRHDQPVYAPVPTVRGAVLERYPAMRGMLVDLGHVVARSRADEWDNIVAYDPASDPDGSGASGRPASVQPWRGCFRACPNGKPR